MAFVERDQDGQILSIGRDTLDDTPEVVDPTSAEVIICPITPDAQIKPINLVRKRGKTLLPGQVIIFHDFFTIQLSSTGICCRCW